MPLHILSSRDLCDDNLITQLNEVFEKGRCLHICATQNLKKLRLFDGDLSVTNNYLITFSELIKATSKDIYENNKCIKSSDQKYILFKLIKYYFENHRDKISILTENTFNDLRHQIFNFFDFLLFYDISIDFEVIELIEQNHTEFEVILFSLYREFKKIIDELHSNNLSPQTLKILADDIKATHGMETVNNLKKQAIKEYIESYDTVVLDGFLFLTDIQKYVIKAALKVGKNVYLTAKINNKITDDYLDSYLFKPLFDEFGQEFKSLEKCRKEIYNNTALDFLRNTYPAVLNARKEDVSNLFKDGSIQIIKPFFNRESEWRYIVEQISSKIQKACGDNEDKIRRYLKDDIALIVTKGGYEARISALLKEIGVFIFKGNTYLEEKCKFKPVKIDFKNIYYRKNDFLDSEVYYTNGELLTYKEKSMLFDKAFEHMKISREFIKPLASYPIVQYILEIYDILLNEISIEKFKTILYSNWHHSINDGTKWDEYLSEFKRIEIFFESSNSIDEWIKIIDNLLNMKSLADEDYLLKYHPLRFVSGDSLNFIKGILLSLSNLIDNINKVSGGIKEHIDALKKSVIKYDDSDINEENEIEKTIIAYLLESLEKMDSAIIKNVSAKYFAQSLRAMISDIEREIELEEKTGLVLNIANLENMKHYKVCFFPMNESNNYPRKYKKDFPFNNKDILDILTLPEYKICKKPSDLNGLKAHLKLEQYLFKNLLDFTDEELIITMTEKEDQTKFSPSLYIKDIWTTFKSKNVWILPRQKSQKIALDFNSKRMPSNQFKSKNNYSLNELAEFKLCPKLYYYTSESIPLFYYTKHQFQFYFVAVLFSSALNEFKKYNRLNKKVYKIPGKDALEVCKDILSNVYAKYVPLFDIFNAYELNDIKRIVVDKLSKFINDICEKSIKGSTFTVVSPKIQKVYKGYDYELTLDYDTKVFDMDNMTNRISQNDIYIDFLVLKTTDSESEPLKHYNDMIKSLNINGADCDRVNLVMKIIGKVNIQFDSVRFEKDGIKRTDNLVREIRKYDFSKAKSMPSKFCTYCRLEETCKARVDRL